MSYVPFKELKLNAEGRWLLILSTLAPSLNRAIEKLPRHVPCPVHGGKDGFRLFKDANSTGGGICNTCGGFSTGFNLLMWINQWRFEEACQAVASCSGDTWLEPKSITIPRSVLSPTKTIDYEKRKKMRELWDSSFSIEDSKSKLLWTYFENRGLGDLTQIPESIKFHPSIPYFNQKKKLGNFPAMVAAIKNLHGEMVSVHRTFLSMAGTKAEVPNPKMLMPSYLPGITKGAAVQLYAPKDKLLLSEGVETALAVYLASNIPAWACISAGNLTHFDPPKSVNRIFICADLDQSGTGENAATVLASKLLRNSIDARIVRIPFGLKSKVKSIDWLDILNGGVR